MRYTITHGAHYKRKRKRGIGRGRKRGGPGEIGKREEGKREVDSDTGKGNDGMVPTSYSQFSPFGCIFVQNSCTVSWTDAEWTSTPEILHMHVSTISHKKQTHNHVGREQPFTVLCLDLFLNLVE